LLPYQIIEPDLIDNHDFSGDLYTVFKRDDENELHYVIDNYWHFAKPKLWLFRLK